jgi:hypothetical protein
MAEQLAKDGGNLSAIVQFTRTAGADGHSLPEAMSAVVRNAFGFVVGTGGYAALAAGLIVLATGAAALFARGRAPLATVLGVLALAGLAAAVAATMRVAGPIFGYLVRWMAMLVVAGVTAMGGALGAREFLPERGRRPALAAALAALAFLCAWNIRAAWVVRQAPPRPLWESVAAGPLAAHIAAGLEQAHVQRPVFEVRTEANRDLVLAVLLSLDKRGVSWAAQPFGPFALGGRWSPTGHEDATVVIGAEGAVPSATPLACEAGHCVYLTRR